MTEENPSPYVASFEKKVLLPLKVPIPQLYDAAQLAAQYNKHQDKMKSVVARLKPSDNFSVRKLITFGDLHGNLDHLKSLWSNLTEELGEQELNRATLVFLGDYCDRGPNTKGVLDWLIQLKNTRESHSDWGRVHFIAGNHDFGMAAFLGFLPVDNQPGHEQLNSSTPEKHTTMEQLWTGKVKKGIHYQGRRWGGLTNYNSKTTFESYGVKTGLKSKKKHRRELITAVPGEHKEFLAGLSWVHEERVPWEPYRLIFVHAGLRPDIPAESQLSALRKRELFDSAVHEPDAPWRLAPFSNRKEVLAPHPDLKGKALIISGHHGFTDLSSPDRVILDASGGRPSKLRPLQALVLPERKIVDSIE